MLISHLIPNSCLLVFFFFFFSFLFLLVHSALIGTPLQWIIHISHLCWEFHLSRTSILYLCLVVGRCMLQPVLIRAYLQWDHIEESEVGPISASGQGVHLGVRVWVPHEMQSLWGKNQPTLTSCLSHRWIPLESPFSHYSTYYLYDGICGWQVGFKCT